MKTEATQIKEHASKTFGFACSKVVPLECSVEDGIVTSCTFSVCGREYAASAYSDWLTVKASDVADGDCIVRDMMTADEGRLKKHYGTW